ncbi:MAG: methylamine utilization protein [Gammaproteobacteria bacterium]|nr:methylamine utilization protein [Gammaproteobacteria bacterium]
MYRKTLLIVVVMLLSGATLQVIARDFVVLQKDKTFVLDGRKVEKYAIKQGDIIHFENQDPWFHNIFSLSDIKTFDLGSFPKGESRAVTFNKTGKVEIECAIHPGMFMEVEVK